MGFIPKFCPLLFPRCILAALCIGFKLVKAGEVAKTLAEGAVCKRCVMQASLFS